MSSVAMVCEKAVTILGKTSDGNDLTGPHLKLVENAVNGFLNQSGLEAFDQLYEQVVKGLYAKPWLLGVVNMTADHEGFIYYKGHRVEHYDDPYNPSNADQLKELAERCWYIESLGIKPDTRKAIWIWHWLKELTPVHPWLNFFSNDPCVWESNDSLVIVMSDRLAHCKHGEVNFFKSIDDFLDANGVAYDREEIDYHKMVAGGFDIPQAGQSKNLSFCYAPFAGVIRLLEKHGVPFDLYERIKGTPNVQQPNG